eukprot:UN22961
MKRTFWGEACDRLSDTKIIRIITMNFFKEHFHYQW